LDVILFNSELSFNRIKLPPSHACRQAGNIPYKGNGEGGFIKKNQKPVDAIY
jgi:hypothetical protein